MRPEPSKTSLAALGLVAALCAAPMVYYGVRQGIDYDGWWHIFVAREVPWAQFWADVYANTHPPLFYLLLRGVTSLGSERLVYRSISIVAAVVATVAVGRIAAHTLRSRAAALLCAFAFGSALTTVIMAGAVRSYMLSVALLLIAFRYYLDLIDPRLPRIQVRTRIAFTAALIGAIAAHYSAIFFFAATLILPCLYAANDADYRSWWRERLWSSWTAELATIVPVVLVVCAEYALHLSAHVRQMAHTAEFYPVAAATSGEWLGRTASFLARGVVAEINLFTPLPIVRLPAAAHGVIVAGIAVVAIGLGMLLRHRSDWVVASTPVLTLAMLTAMIAVAALFRRYPFGGFLRHQFILFPFIVLVCFAVVDALVARLRRPWLVLGGAAAVIVLNGLVQWRLLHFADREPSAPDIANFTEQFDDAYAVYVDQFSLIPFFANHQRAEWAAASPLGDTFAAIPVRIPERRSLVLRDKTRWVSDLADPGLYGDLRAAIEATGLPWIDVIRLRLDAHRFAPPTQLENAQLRESLVGAARSEGLRVERVVHDGHHIYARVARD